MIFAMEEKSRRRSGPHQRFRSGSRNPAFGGVTPKRGLSTMDIRRRPRVQRWQPDLETEWFELTPEQALEGTPDWKI